jgi:hypothetical protein
MINKNDIKKTFVPQKVYSLLVKSRKGSLIHIGVHYTLDEAYDAAKAAMTLLFGESKDHVDMDLWTTLEADQVISSMVIPGKENRLQRTAISSKKSEDRGDPLEEMIKAKNTLMASILATKDLERLKKASPLLSKHDIKYLMSKIEGNTKTHDEVDV